MTCGPAHVNPFVPKHVNSLANALQIELRQRGRTVV